MTYKHWQDYKFTRKKITRNTTLKFETTRINVIIDLTKMKGSTLGKRKKPQNQGNISEPGRKAEN